MKGFIKKLMLAGTLAAFAFALLAYAFMLYFEAVEEEHYRDNALDSFQSGYTTIEKELEPAKAALDALELPFDLNAGAPGYAGVGRIQIFRDLFKAVITYKVDNVIHTLDVSADYYQHWHGEYMLHVKDGFTFFGKAMPDADGAAEEETFDYKVVVRKGSLLTIPTLFEYNFENYCLIDSGGLAVDRKKDVPDIISVPQGNVNGEYKKIQGSQYLMFSKSVPGFSDYYFTAVIKRSTVNAYIKQLSSTFYIFLYICGGLAVIFFVAFLVLLKRDNIKVGLGDYRIDVDVQGNILDTDKSFDKRYKRLIGNISNYVAEEFSANSVIIKVETQDGNREFLNCKRITQRRSAHVVFLGNDVTDIYNEYNRFRLEHFTDDVTSMQNIQQLENDFSSAVNSRNTKMLGFIIFELGIEKYWALYGIEFYKKLLKALGERLSEVYVWQAKTYYLTSDRFLILIDENIKEVISKLDSAIEYVSAPIRIDDMIVRISCKAGYLIFSSDEEDLALSQIISRTELALSYARASNKKNYYGYVDNVMRSKQTLSNEDIKQIILANEINVNFQPQYSLAQERIVGFEALTRISGKYNYINPGVFIENVEQSGAMMMLGEYILDKSMKFAATLEDKSIKVSVNVSPLQLLGEKFVEKFISNLNAYKLEPSQIGIEITETYEMSSMAKAREKLRELQKHGIHVGIDDFGEKYSSLRYIKNLPINSIKIDKGFVDGVETERYSRAIVETIIELAKKLSLYSILEGVETRGQVDTVKSLGADIIQGYIISPAVDEESAYELLKTKKNLFLEGGDKS